jgi:hypothetical protein
MTWGKQVAHFQRLVGRDTDEDHAAYVASKRALHERGAWNAIDNIIDDAICGLIAFGPEFSRHRLGPLHAYVADSVAAYLLTVEGEYSLSTMPFELADSANFFQILGYPIANSVLASLAPLLERIETNRREHPAWHWHHGFMALALHVAPVWRGIAGLTTGAPSFTACAAFGPNVQGLLAYLGAAIETHATLEAVIPAWKTTLAVFPALRDAREVTYSILPWIARVVYHDIGAMPVGEVAATLYADIQALVSAGM